MNMLLLLYGVIPNVGGLPDVVTDGKTGYLVEAENVDALADSVVRFFQGDAAAQMQDGVKEE